MYLAVPAPVSGVVLALARVLGSLGSLQCPRGYCGAGAGFGTGSLVVVFGPGSRGRGGRLAAPLSLPPALVGLAGLVLPRGRSAPLPLGLPVQVVAEVPLHLAEVAGDDIQLGPLLQPEVYGPEASFRWSRD